MNDHHWNLEIVCKLSRVWSFILLRVMEFICDSKKLQKVHCGNEKI